MSGGYFEYKQYELNAIADSIEQVIIDEKDRKLSEYENILKWDFKDPQTILEFHNALAFLKKAVIYAQRIDYLLEGDDGEESFHTRLKEDLENIKTYGNTKPD